MDGGPFTYAEMRSRSKEMSPSPFLAPTVIRRNEGSWRPRHPAAYARWVKNTPAVTFSQPALGGSQALATQPASGVVVGGCRVLAGSSSWADRSLVRDGSFYPSRSLSARQRLLYYASRLPLTEVATTYKFPPTPDVARRWVASTPPGFTIDVRAWSLLCGAPTWPESLWADLQGHVRPSRREGAKLYRHHLPATVVEECWDRFNHAVRPLAEAGRLGAVVVRFPSWFHPRPTAWSELIELPARLPGLTVAVELTSERWFEGDACEQTLGLLEELGLGFVCRDGGGPRKPIVAATSEVGFVRFTGAAGAAGGRRGARGQTSETAAGEGGVGASSERGSGASFGGESDVASPAGEVTSDDEPPTRFVDEAHSGGSPAWGPQAGETSWSYRYSERELAAWAPAIKELASCTDEVHLIMDNCWRTNAVDNAASLLELVAH
jgi:uncharacterized protein YecE (DUF72 family)